MPSSATSPVTESSYSCTRKDWIAKAPPNPVTTGRIAQPIRPRCGHDGVVKMTTLVANERPLAAAPPTALDAAHDADEKSRPAVLANGGLMTHWQRRSLTSA